ncbi:MAG: hypothetical protein NC132_06835, partial [Corallococcus sp.]|nr:hypothetical protein [Corallococcus sp.]
MKNRLLLAAIIIMIIASVLCGCDDVNDEPPQINLTVRSPYDTQGVTVTEEEFDTYDYTKLFMLRSDEREFPVEKSYLDLSGLTADGGAVKCVYNEQSAGVTVYVTRKLYELHLSQDYVTVTVPQLETYDFNALYLAKTDGGKAEITDDMVTSSVKPVAGNYKYTVNFHGISQTLNVQVLDEVVITPIKTNYISLGDIDVKTYDYTQLFTMTVNGVKAEVKNEYIDASQAEEGVSYFTVFCKYGDT